MAKKTNKKPQPRNDKAVGTRLKMLTQDQVLQEIKNGRNSQCLDGRDYSRLCNFFPIGQWGELGFSVTENFDVSKYDQKPWTREEIIKQLQNDVAFGF